MPTEVDYELEAIQVRFDAGHKNALNEWRAAFDTARKQWQLDRARRLLHLLKARALDENYLGMLRFYEGALLLDLGEWKKAQKALEQSIEICRKLGDQKGELSAVNSLANLFRRNADTLESAIDTFQTALQSNLAVGVSKVILLNGLGLTLYEKDELQQANDYFQEVLNLAQQMSDDELRASALHNLGSVAWTRGKLHDAQVLLEQAQKIQRTAQDKHGLAETLNSLGLVLEGLGQWDEAIASYQNALEQMQTVSDFYGQSQILVNLEQLANQCTQ